MLVKLILAGLVLLVGGLVLMIQARLSRRARGLGSGETVALDNVTLFSRRHLLVGRPDRVVKQGDFFIPEEWKSAREVKPWHIAQLATYFILIEEHYGVRPPHGFIVLGNGHRERIENTDKLRGWVLDTAGRIREHREQLGDEIDVAPERWKCRVCGQRGRCGQSVA